MQFTIHDLSEPLSSHIESVFHFAHFQPDHSVERVVPTGHLYLLFALDGMTRHTFEADGQTIKDTHNNVWLSGNHRNHITISAHPDSEMLVVQFKAHGALPFIHHGIDRYTEQIVPAEQVFGDAVLALHATLCEKTAVAEKFAAVQKWLEQRFDAELSAPQDLIDFAAQLRAEPVTAFKDLLASYPHSQKHLIDQFKQHIGMTPKYFQRIMRFNELLQQIHQQQRIAWSDVAYQCGYADQSHFIKEFKLFSGLNPTEFLDRDFQDGEGNFFPLDQNVNDQ